MDYEGIMKQITLGLTGDPAKDIPYLEEQSDKYEDHELSKEILRGIGRLMYDVLPEDIRKEYNQKFQNLKQATEAAIEEAQFQMYKKNYKRALELLEGIIKKIEGDYPNYREDEVSQYFNFDNALEEIIYKEIYQPKKEVRINPESFAKLYSLYGSLLFELRRYDEAQETLEKAMKWNPVKAEIMFELGEIFKLRKQYDEYLELTKRCLECAYSSRHIARCYRNLGYYYIEQKEYDTAIVLYYLSLQFDNEDKTASSELLYISQETGKQIKEPSLKKVETIMKKQGIQFGANPLVYNIAFFLGKDAQENKEFDAARYFYEIAYELTGDEDVKKIIDDLPDENNQE